MRFLPFINGDIFMILYVLYSIFIIMNAYEKVIKIKKADYLSVKNLTEEEFFVLNNKYNLNLMFYYYTYRLYAKNILTRDNKKKSFYIVNKNLNMNDFSPLEKEVCRLYLNEFRPNRFKYKMINKKIFKRHYDEIYDNLEERGLIEQNRNMLYKKIQLFLYKCALFIPGIWRAFGGIVYDRPIEGLVYEIIFIWIAQHIILKFKRDNLLTESGLSSAKYFVDYYNKNIDLSESDIQYNNVMKNFLIANTWRKVLGLTSSNRNNNNSSCSSCTSCSSCSSCTSCSSCSSCSSCGGCGGGDS